MKQKTAYEIQQETLTEIANRLDDLSQYERLFILWYLLDEYKKMMEEDVKDLEKHVNDWKPSDVFCYMNAMKHYSVLDEVKELIGFTIF